MPLTQALTTIPTGGLHPPILRHATLHSWRSGCTALLVVGTAAEVAEEFFARALCAQGCANAAVRRGRKVYTLDHEGVHVKLVVEPTQVRLSFFPKGQRRDSKRLGYFRVETSGDTLTVRLAFWYSSAKDGDGQLAKDAYPWLRPLRASALVLWLWRLRGSSEAPARIILDDVENAQTIRLLAQLGAGCDRTYDFADRTAADLAATQTLDPRHPDGISLLFSQSPVVRMVRHMWEETGGSLERLHVRYPFDPSGWCRQPSLVFEFTREGCLPRSGRDDADA